MLNAERAVEAGGMGVEEFGKELMRGNAGLVVIIKAAVRGNEAVKFGVQKGIGQGPAQTFHQGDIKREFQPLPLRTTRVAKEIPARFALKRHQFVIDDNPEQGKIIREALPDIAARPDFVIQSLLRIQVVIEAAPFVGSGQLGRGRHLEGG